MSRNFASDQTLIDSLRLNDTEAFEELFRRYWYNLYIYSLKKLHSSDHSRQIVRELFKELWEKRHSWPADFSLSQHLYAEVRKAVVKHLNESLTSDIDDAVVRDQILPGFSVNSLQQAKLPVMKKHVMNKPEESAKQHAIRRRTHAYSNLVNMKWLFNIVNTNTN
jgi:DNA-directed RNA polymerase specialized sigma24 family protein